MMIDRRKLFGVPLLLLPGALLLNPVEAVEPKPFRRWYQYVRALDTWKPIAFEDIRAGMEIWVEDSSTGSEVVYASSDCIRGEFFTVGARIDPNTNQWVDVPCRNSN